MTKEKSEIFESEWAILQVVWKSQPCPAPMVQKALQKKKKWSYSTVKTIMDRMVKKGLLEKEKMCNLYLYSSAISELQAQKGEITRTIKRAFSGTLTPMMHFLLNNENISRDELDELERVIREKKRANNDSTKK